MIIPSTNELIRAALEPHKTHYSDAELQQLATTTSGTGEIGPEDARNAIKVREALAALNKPPRQLEAEWVEALKKLFAVHGPRFEKNPELLAFVKAVQSFAEAVGRG